MINFTISDTAKFILNQELDQIVYDLKQKHIELGMRASGKWIESLEVQINDTSGEILGEDYTEELVNGRPPGKFPPIDAIKKWIYDKGIQSEIPLNSLAFLIARKIAEKGTNYFEQGGTDLISAVITPERTQGILDRIGLELSLQLIDLIDNKFKAVA